MTQQGWGEGLDEAARWLNQHAAGEELVVASWYPGVMRTYFNGKTMSLSSRHDERVGYVVIYRNMFGRAPDDPASNAIDEFRDKAPVYVVRIAGVEYVWIYEQLGLPYFSKHIGELVGETEVGQLLPGPVDKEFDHIEIGLSTFSGRSNTEDIVLRVYDSIDSDIPLRTVRVNARDVVDSEWHRFTFESIENVSENTFYISLVSPTSTPGNAITVRFAEQDIRKGQMVLRRRILRDGEDLSDFLRDGDLAYRF